MSALRVVIADDEPLARRGLEEVPMSLLRLYCSLPDSPPACRWALVNEDRDTVVGEGDLSTLPRHTRRVQVVLPASQVAPMTRIQLARDRAMAQTAREALRPGQTVRLVAGHQHVRRDIGVPQHLPAGLQVKSVRLLAGGKSLPGESFDSVWATEALPDKDYCAGLREQFKKPGAAKP